MTFRTWKPGSGVCTTAFAIVFLLFLVACPVHGQVILDSEEQAFLRLINDYRAANGLSSMQASPLLTASSKWMSADMAQRNYFSHTDSAGRDAFSRMKAFGYTFNTWLGENLAAGYGDAINTFAQWRNSPGHNENMLNPNFTAIGIGRAYNSGAYYRYYWTTDFGGYADGIGGGAITVAAVTTVNAANYQAGVAPESIAALFGNNIANGTYIPSSFPLPKSLGGTTVKINGTAADLLYVSPTQINYVMPSGTAAGSATVEVSILGNVVGRGNASVDTVSPGIFTITSDGSGIPTGYTTYDGRTLQALYNSNGTARALDPGTVQRPDYLVVFGTGFRRRTSLSGIQVYIGGILAQVDYAGAQGTYAGLDQLQLVIPPTARGSGAADIIFVVDGRQANRVRVNIGN